MTDSDFDFSDIQPVDGVREALDVAVSVIQDYGLEGETRIERLAKFILRTMRADVMQSAEPSEVMWLGGEHVWLDVRDGPVTPDDARELSTALLLCADQADAYTEH